MTNLNTFVERVVASSDAEDVWYEDAEEVVQVLVDTFRGDEIILFSNIGFSYVNSVLALEADVSPPDVDSLEHGHISPDAHWSITHVSGGGEPDRMYLASPMDSHGSKALDRGEHLVFRRDFTGVDKGSARTEISQRLVQALDLYFLEERNAYCKLDENGDIVSVIKLQDFSEQLGQPSAMLVTIKSVDLHRYMAVTSTALVVKFDITKYRSGTFFGWHDPTRDRQVTDDLFFHSGEQSSASFANGCYILRTKLTVDDLIVEDNKRWQGNDKQYATFKAHDWKNDLLSEISCAPDALASYFEKDSKLPFQVTPAFFRSEVLLKYKNDSEKYKLETRSIHSRGGWYLKSYDINRAGQVHAYLCDLSNLPYEEQLYWKSFNEWPKGGVSKRAFETDFEGSFTSIIDPLDHLRGEISKLDGGNWDWWDTRGKDLRERTHAPVTDSIDEWSTSLLSLDQLVVEGLRVKGLRAILAEQSIAYERQWGSLKLLELVLMARGHNEDEVKEVVSPFRELRHLRTKTKGHHSAKERDALVKKARSSFGNLREHFIDLSKRVADAFDRVVEKI